MVILAGLTAALAWYFLVPSQRWRSLFPARPAPPRRLPGWAWLVPVLALGWSTFPGLRVWMVIGTVATATAGWLIGRVRRDREISRRRSQTARMCSSLAAQLAAGDLPDQALRRLAVDHPELADVVRVRDIGGDVADVLLRLGAQPGREGLSAMGRAWALSQTTGAPLVPAVITVADGLRQRRGLEQTVAAELSTTRSSGRMMAVLPLVGLAMGFTTGGDPLSFLVATRIGQLCVGGAVVLVCAGLVWTTRLGADLMGSTR